MAFALVAMFLAIAIAAHAGAEISVPGGNMVVLAIVDIVAWVCIAVAVTSL